MVEIRTNRLVLRPVAIEDAEYIIDTLNDFEVSKYLSAVPYPYAQSDAEEWVAMQTGSDDPMNTNFTVFLHNDTYVGAVGFAEGAEGPELGYYINRTHWRNGYVTEAANAALAWLFDTTDAKTVTSGAYAFNPASLAVQAKLGFVETGTEDRMSNSQGKALPLITTKLQRENFKPLEGRHDV